MSKSEKKIWVIKVGSALVIEGGPLLVRAWMKQVALLKRRFKIDVVWVTSGAIASARFRTRKKWKLLPEKQALSAIGQPMLMEAYGLALQAEKLLSGQVLLTYNDMARATPRKNLKNTLSKLLQWNVVPILNENDAVATEEIQFGDNDLLSAKVAALMGAERLVILTNVHGLYDRNPQKDKTAQLISRLARVSKQHLDATDKGAKSKVGRGGMYSKLRAAAYAQKQGVPTWILKGDIEDGLLKIARQMSLGTQIGPSPRRP
jgi:glutamate 5-kinase